MLRREFTGNGKARRPLFRGTFVTMQCTTVLSLAAFVLSTGALGQQPADPAAAPRPRAVLRRAGLAGLLALVLGADDGLNVQIKFPSSTPYLGFGWGHQQAGGFRMASDVGVMIGKAKLTAVGRGAQLGSGTEQANIDREAAKLSDGVGKIRILPQLSVSLGYSF